MKISYIGLGKMGRPMAQNLLRKGFDLTVVNRSQAKVAEMAAQGAHAGTIPAEAAKNAEVACLCLAGEDIVRSVITGPDGVLAGAAPGLLVLDHSTIAPQTAREMEAACAAKGVTYLDAPVSGTGRIVERGELTIMVGGALEGFERAQPVLRAVGTSIHHMGPVGSGNLTKLLNNLAKDINIAAVMEVLVVGAKAGVDLDALFAVIRGASGGSAQWERVGPALLARDFEATATIGNLVHTQRVIADLAAANGVPVAVFEAARGLWLQALEMGLGDASTNEAVRVLERAAGVEVRGRAAQG